MENMYIARNAWESSVVVVGIGLRKKRRGRATCARPLFNLLFSYLRDYVVLPLEVSLSLLPIAEDTMIEW